TRLRTSRRSKRWAASGRNASVPDADFRSQETGIRSQKAVASHQRTVIREQTRIKETVTDYCFCPLTPDSCPLSPDSCLLSPDFCPLNASTCLPILSLTGEPFGVLARQKGSLER